MAEHPASESKNESKNLSIKSERIAEMNRNAENSLCSVKNLFSLIEETPRVNRERSDSSAEVGESDRTLQQNLFLEGFQATVAASRPQRRKNIYYPVGSVPRELRDAVCESSADSNDAEVTSSRSQFVSLTRRPQRRNAMILSANSHSNMIESLASNSEEERGTTRSARH